jgi:hypothetical protein
MVRAQAPRSTLVASVPLRYCCPMAGTDSKDELTIEKHARAAAEAALKFIPKEAWDAARRLREVRDQLRLVPRQVLDGVAEQFQEANRQVNELLRSVTRPVLEVVDVVRSPEMQELLKRALKAFKRLPVALRDALTMLGTNGWYPDHDMEMPDLLEFARRFEVGEEEKTNDALCRQFEVRGEAIIAELVTIAPERAPYLRAAFEAHRDGKYALSIPVFLAQADGMWRDFTNADKEKRLYSRTKGKPRTAKWVASVKSDDLDEALLYPLVAPLPISASDGEEVPKGALVRNRVLHGTDLNYATALNSYRALSHLSYVGSVIRDDGRWTPAPSQSKS